MSKDRGGIPTAQRACYWLGLILSFACGSVIFFGPTALLGLSQDMLSAIIGALAVLAFAVGEYFDPGGAENTEGAPLLERDRESEVQSSGEHIGRRKNGSAVGELDTENLGSRGVEIGNGKLSQKQVAALSRATDLLDEVLKRIRSGDERSAESLIRDARRRIGSIQS